MIGNANLNFTQSINSFMRPLGLSLSSKDQIAAKITTLAFGILFVANNEFLSSALATTVGEAVDYCRSLPTGKERADCLEALECTINPTVC